MTAGAEVASAFVTLVPSARGFGAGIEKELDGDLDKAGKKSGEKFGSSMGLAAKAPIAAALAGGALLGLGKGLIADARESARIGALTEQVIKTTGGAAKISAPQVGDLATAISNKTGADDEAIQSGANLLLTFTNIRNEAGKGNDVFNQTTALALDMATALGTDTKASALQLGKALNDPIKGVTALSRSGVSFTAQQKEQIKTLVESGNILGAQKVILNEVGKEFGGAAAAAGTPADRLRTTIGNLREEAGARLIPAVDKVATLLVDRVIPGLTSTVGFVTSNATAFKILGAAVLAIALGFGIYTAAVRVTTAVTSAYTTVQALLNGTLALNPIGLVIVGLVALGAALFVAYKKSETFRNIINGAFTVIRAVVVTAITVIRTTVTAVFGFLQGYFSTVIGGYISVFRGGLTLIRGIFTGDFGKIKAGVVQILGGLLQVFTALPRRILSALGNLGGLLLSAGGDLIRGFITGIKNKAGDLVKAIRESITDKLPGFVKKALGINSPSRVFMEIGGFVAQGMAVGIERGGQRVDTAAQALIPAPRMPGFARAGLPTSTVAPGSTGGGLSQSVTYIGVTPEEAMRQANRELLYLMQTA